MCGIFGLNIAPESSLNSSEIKEVVSKLFRLSERRGKDASGLMLLTSEYIHVYKSPIKASKTIKTKKYKDILNKALENYSSGDGFTLAGHTRMVTHGSENYQNNNQPILKQNSVLMHNGIIVNESEILQRFTKLKKQYDVDSEVFLLLFNYFIEKGNNLLVSFKRALNEVKGGNTFALFNAKNKNIYLHSSNGSLYFLNNPSLGVTVFSSEKNVLLGASKIFLGLTSLENISEVIQAKKDEIFYVDTKTSKINSLLTKDSDKLSDSHLLKAEKKIICHVFDNYNQKKIFPHLNNYSLVEKELKLDLSLIDSLQRCIKCILPETFPYISFNSSGECNFCSNYKRSELLGLEKLLEAKEQWSKNAELNDILVPISGGRDSSYTLHFVKKELKLNPIAYTYDWGFVTDQARRNISRMCGELNVEHVLVAADIKKKRENVKKDMQIDK